MFRPAIWILQRLKFPRIWPALTGLAGSFLLWGVAGCTGDTRSPAAADQWAAPSIGRPSRSEMENYLDQEFNRLGIDPTKVAAVAPAGDANAVFDLQAEIYTGDPPIISFSWTERVLGDYNQDGLVSVNDLTPIGQRYNESVEHDDPAAHDGLAYWPSGDPDGAGADNWRAARIDGNDDGLIYLTDITTIAQHWNERLDGYRLYFQTPSMDDFALLPNPGDAGSPLTVPRSVADPGDPNRPFRYELNYTPPAEEGVYQFYVAAYDASTDTEGMPSPLMTLPEGEPPVATLTASAKALALAVWKLLSA